MYKAAPAYEVWTQSVTIYNIKTPFLLLKKKKKEKEKLIILNGKKMEPKQSNKNIQFVRKRR